MPWLCSIILLPLNLIFCEAYTNSLLANLNARKSIGAIGRPNDNFSFNSDFFKTSPGTQVKYVFSLTSLISLTQQPSNLSKVDVAKEFTRNEQLDHASDVKDRDPGSLSAEAC